MNDRAITKEELIAEDLTAALQAKRIWSSIIFNIKDFGAKGTGDDRRAIQDAIDKAHENGGGTVYIPSGTFSLGSQSTEIPGYLLILRPGVSIDGPGTLRVGNGVAPYMGIFEQSKAHGDLNDVFYVNFTIDENAVGNPLTVDPIHANPPIDFRRVFHIYSGDNMVFDNLTMKNGVNQNSIITNKATNITINACRFLNMGADTTTNHDHSTLYVVGDGAVITNNIFQAKGIGIRTAIEIHGQDKLIQGNIISRYRIGLIYDSDERNNVMAKTVNIDNNIMNDVYFGIELWSMDGEVNSLNVTNNNISINRNGYFPVNGLEGGILLYTPSKFSVRNLDIKNNKITYTRDTVSRNTISYASGIRLVLDNLPVDMENVSVTNNTIVGALGSGISWYCKGRNINVKIKDNEIINPGSTLYGTLSDDFKSGLIIYNNDQFINCLVENNRFIDTQAAPTMKFGIRFNGRTADQAESNLRIVNNQVLFNKGAAVPFKQYYSFVTNYPIFHAEIPSWDIRTVFNAPYRSSIYDPVSGREYIQTKPGVGNIWRSNSYAMEAPATGYWNQGDSVTNTFTVYGGNERWVCTVGGRAHLHSNGNTTLGSPVLTNVTNVQTWEVGDRIRSTHIPDGSTIAAVDVTQKTVTISNPATGNSIGYFLYDAAFYPVGIVNGNQLLPQSDSAAGDLSSMRADFNELLKRLRAAGLMSYGG
ncbi:right-handed parallel beta-helix repeat-containing protein [Paenibacillus chitinolyticus]|uniref:hypothetical protein n=1 Tax=Paenibacillus chitinolyticus TaxID=79263 RepID=UPI003655F155